MEHDKASIHLSILEYGCWQINGLLKVFKRERKLISLQSVLMWRPENDIKIDSGFLLY